MAEQSNNDDYIKEDSNKEIENEQQENNLEIEQLNETLILRIPIIIHPCLQ